MYTFTIGGNTYTIEPYMLAIVGGIYGLSLFVVLGFSSRHRDTIRDALSVLFRFEVWGSIAFIVFYVWQVITDFEFTARLETVLDEWKLSATSSGVEAFWSFITTLYIFAVFLGGAFVTYLSIKRVWGCQRIFVTLATLPILAVMTILWGAVTFLTTPITARDIKHTIKHQHKHPDAGAHIQKVISKEAEKVLAMQYKWWKPTFRKTAATRHYHNLAKYLDSLVAVTDAAEKKVESEEKKKHD
jgi:hypothetical protein